MIELAVDDQVCDPPRVQGFDLLCKAKMTSGSDRGAGKRLSRRRADSHKSLEGRIRLLANIGQDNSGVSPDQLGAVGDLLTGDLDGLVLWQRPGGH